MKYARLATVLLVVFSVGSAVFADWDPNTADPRLATNHKMHFPQMPQMQPDPVNDLSGLNVRATAPKVVADDFRCTWSGPIRDIHIWGSWLDDNFPQHEIDDGAGPIITVPDPGFVGFHLSIHADIPAIAGEHSRPGNLLWEKDFFPGEFQHRLWGTSVEGFFDPNQDEIIGTDTQVIQYNFFLEDTEAFPQVKDTIYWLDVMALPLPEWDNQPVAPVWGWKTSADHWNDDSVYGDYDALGNPPTTWNELFDPRVLPGQTPVSLDQAFVITPEPATMSLLCIGGLALLRRRRFR
ncbi:MAG: PEP-CTERM sorting domain-containing protein [Phycisphaerae bacterium]|nr:PEP-CTERM sorting domain-containing protein [Phycisphaerae bacterium]